MAIYTKKGDKGDTGLFGTTKRISKDSQLVKTLGAIDEANSFLGIALTLVKGFRYKNILWETQSNLFTIGSILAGSDLKLNLKSVKELEKIIDELEGTLPVLKNFILPGGTALASHLMYTRTLVRKAERETVGLSKKMKVNGEILIYLNRLSDCLFILARYSNYISKVKEDIWKK